MFTVNQELNRKSVQCPPTSRQRRHFGISSDITNAYIELHKIGLCTFLEIWLDGKLGRMGLRVALGKTFFCESMFHCNPMRQKLR